VLSTFLVKSRDGQREYYSYTFKVAFYCRTAYQVCRTNDDETSPTDEYVDEVDLELGVCPGLYIHHDISTLYDSFYVLY
jgi:hypothetical protein